MAGAVMLARAAIPRIVTRSTPTSATSYGLDTGKRAHQRGEIDDGSLAGIVKAKALNASQRRRLDQINRTGLTGSDQLNYDIVMYGLTTADDASKEFDYGGPGAGAPYTLSQLTGSYCQLPSFLDSQHPVETKADADAYLAALHADDHYSDIVADHHRLTHPSRQYHYGWSLALSGIVPPETKEV